MLKLTSSSLSGTLEMKSASSLLSTTQGRIWRSKVVTSNLGSDSPVSW